MSGAGAPTAASGPPEGEAERAKAVLRAAVRSRRRTRTDRERADAARGLRDVVLRGLTGMLPATGAVVAVYAARGGEPGTGPLREALAERGVRVLLPVTKDGTDGAGVRLGWRWDGSPAPTTGELGGDALGLADVVLLPALAVDTAGRRLGQGGGYYDRSLALLTAGRAGVPLVALLHDDEVLDAAVEPVPVAAHDVPVTHVATPSRWLRLDGS